MQMVVLLRLREEQGRVLQFEEYLLDYLEPNSHDFPGPNRFRVGFLVDDVELQLLVDFRKQRFVLDILEVLADGRQGNSSLEIPLSLHIGMEIKNTGSIIYFAIALMRSRISSQVKK